MNKNNPKADPFKTALSRPSKTNKSDNFLSKEIKTKQEGPNNHNFVSTPLVSELEKSVKKLFEVEKEAALEANQTGIYISWRCPEFSWDCQRVASSSMCFCGHILDDHKLNNKKLNSVPCLTIGCPCKVFSWVPSRPEEVGEFWLRRRKNFDASKWRASCRCKHGHDDHEPFDSKKCKKCACRTFRSNFLCVACDRHWEEHRTFFETVEERIDNGMTVGANFLPFSDIPSLRRMILSGENETAGVSTASAVVATATTTTAAATTAAAAATTTAADAVDSASGRLHESGGDVAFSNRRGDSVGDASDVLIVNSSSPPSC